MRKVMEIGRRERPKGKEAEIKAVCLLWREATEINQAADEYFPVCDPLSAQRARAIRLRTEAALARVDVSVCAKPPAASTRKRI
ncbi:hypothetical protein MHY87_16495 [Microvirga sp. ACRRW]|uniref:hypothetical protein n=1 Tax=Microvirga sp. ACRRW TaxID=2918205 RepID=UPI001EF4B438|nr:hypothetical protein [Microvirga sp. ACRRW]MCG7394505.1 hypothetical protein [Microvirga sp. ACRRW]